MRYLIFFNYLNFSNLLEVERNIFLIFERKDIRFCFLLVFLVFICVFVLLVVVFENFKVIFLSVLVFIWMEFD